ncbi:MAG: HD domain-containing protein [Treponema sp.]|jgi:GTP pyrophosphokinase|nr:HD domain-containing protein [Treponema sp.]
MEKSFALFMEKVNSYEDREQKRILKAAARTPAPLSHALGIASILADLNLDADTLIAALLLFGSPRHSISVDSVREQFGEGVARIVEGTLKAGNISAKNKTLHEAENIRKMLFAMAEDIRFIFIKLAEKLHTLRSMDTAGGPNTGASAETMAARELSAEDSILPENQKSFARECLDIYAPLADRLGISWIKDELEDLSLKFLNRDVYRQIKEIVAGKRGERREFLNAVQENIRREAESAGIGIHVSSRAKHFYSIYQKMRKRNKTPGDLFDLFGIRILCDGIENCYTLLGLVHRLWKPLEGRFKDYIAMPKSNGYRSLHTTVMVPTPPGKGADGGEGCLLEIQIRTREMHHIAEYGLASHWLYKKGSGSEIVRPVDISIVNRLRDWKQKKNEQEQDSRTFLDDIKREILKDSIYVFTPQGKVIELPAGSCAIDFAYSIHSAVGDHCIGARADGQIIPLNAELRNTQVVEILTSQSAHPHLNWLRMVKTARARSKIRSWLEQNDDSIIIEKNVVAKKKPLPSPAPPLPAAEKEIPPVQRVLQHNDEANFLHVRVEDEKNMMIRFARCCRPVTGDAIIGYISRGRGIIIHRKNCSNLANIPDFEERKIEAEWENAVSVLVKRFKVEARVSADLFAEIEGAVRKHQGHLIEGRLEETSPRRLTGFFTMQLEDSGALKGVIKNIKGIPAVLSVQPLN